MDGRERGGRKVGKSGHEIGKETNCGHYQMSFCGSAASVASEE